MQNYNYFNYIKNKNFIYKEIHAYIICNNYIKNYSSLKLDLSCTTHAMRMSLSIILLSQFSAVSLIASLKTREMQSIRSGKIQEIRSAAPKSILSFLTTRRKIAHGRLSLILEERQYLCDYYTSSPYQRNLRRSQPRTRAFQFPNDPISQRRSRTHACARACVALAPRIHGSSLFSTCYRKFIQLDTREAITCIVRHEAPRLKRCHSTIIFDKIFDKFF